MPAFLSNTYLIFLVFVLPHVVNGVVWHYNAYVKR